jgi:hypothetical protein
VTVYPTETSAPARARDGAIAEAARVITRIVTQYTDSLLF